MLNVGYKLEEYWKEVRFRHRKNLNCKEPIENIAKQPDQTWVQCDDCLKWRKIPDGVDTKKLPKKWFCHMNPDEKFRSCTVEEEPENADEEPPRCGTLYREYLFSATYVLTFLGFRPSVHIQDPPLIITPTRTKRTLGQSQEAMEIKKVRRKGSVDSIPDSALTSTASPGMCNSGNDANEAESEIAPMDNSDDHSAVQQKQINHITQTSSEDQLNYKLLYLKAMEEIKQLQQKLMEQEKAEKELMGKLSVDVLEADKCTLSTCCESLQKDLEDIKRENKKVKLSAEDQSVQTDFQISSTEESATTSTEASNLRRGIDLQFGIQKYENEDRRGSGQENNNTQLCR
ncbi:hypothetical protein Q7C36_009081 [Tachysurus vachellii]|uniref:CW-type domain-containing protein n=1 Tax=Tachysurus vachellii TaxID=175792 RepID=A0AA88N3K9_TACVA|nr:hypothetical protein Q7C36_009081 [Tachysurus vachellii]